MSDALERLAELLRAERGPLAESLVEPGATDEGANGVRGFGALVASGPRATGAPGEYELLMEAIFEGYLLHYGRGRIIVEADVDLALLAGDRLYALGLDRLVALGDVAAVAELADVIALCALAHSRGDQDLALAVWEAGARAVGWGSCAAHETAKRHARVGDPTAAALLRTFAGGADEASSVGSSRGSR